MPEEVRLGVVGFGRVVRDYHLPALRELTGVRLVAAADPLERSRQDAAREIPGIETYDDHLAMLERTSLDGVIVASPPSTHLRVWSDVASKGLATFVEKPLVLSSQLDDLDRQPPPGRVMIGFNRRFWPTYTRVRDLVRRGVIGSPAQVEYTLHLDVLGWSTVTRHRLDAREGGVLHDLGCHAIDLAVHLLGEVPWGIVAESASRLWADDTVRLHVVFPSGSTAACDLAYGHRTRERLVVRGPDAAARLEDANMALHVDLPDVTGGGLAAGLHDVTELAYRAMKRSQTMSRASIRGALAAFLRAMRGEGPFSPGFDDGVRSARWIAAAARSIAERGAMQRLNQ